MEMFEQVSRKEQEHFEEDVKREWNTKVKFGMHVAAILGVTAGMMLMSSVLKRWMSAGLNSFSILKTA